MPSANLNPQQSALADLPVGNVLLIAPAGCGKSEALAGRARSVLQRGEVAAPQKILALTFSNKARDNLAARMLAVVGAGWRQSISAMNFHGLAARVIKAHGSAVGISREIILPEEPWRRRQLRDLGVDSFVNNGPFEEALRFAKAGPYDDEGVMSRLTASGVPAAMEFEHRLRAEGRLDYDDLIRNCRRLLEIPEIGRLYRAHFGMVLVDEVQDLSMLQFGIVRAVGGDRVTYAGDPAQGIYSFAGADPVGVFQQIRALDPEVIEFNLSYRSAPAVLRAVNALAAEMGGTQLECADPGRWPDGGSVISLERSNTDEEAAAVVGQIADLLGDPSATVGVLGRRGSRLDPIRQACTNAGVSFEDWSVPTDVPSVVALLLGNFQKAVSAGGTEDEILLRLERQCRELTDPTEADTLDEIARACDALRETVLTGVSLLDAIASCRRSGAPGAAVAPGLHVLTGHKGKGQEFDWVFVVGLEEGHIPDFRNTDAEALAEELRVLHVMVSRARSGLIFTRSRNTPSRSGWWEAAPSRWLDVLRGSTSTFDHN